MQSANRRRPGAPTPNVPGTSSNTKPFMPAPKQVDAGGSHSESGCDSYFPEPEKGHAKDGAKNWASGG